MTVSVDAVYIARPVALQNNAWKKVGLGFFFFFTLFLVCEAVISTNWVTMLFSTWACLPPQAGSAETFGCLCFSVQKLNHVMLWNLSLAFKIVTRPVNEH